MKRSEVYATKIQTASSGRELRASFQSTPIYHYELRLNFLRQAAYNTIVDEVATLKTFFDTMLGAWRDLREAVALQNRVASDDWNHYEVWPGGGRRGQM